MYLRTVSRSRLLRLAPVVALFLAACSGGGGGPSAPGPDPDPDPGDQNPPPSSTPDLSIEWDGSGRSWGEPVTLRATLAEGVQENRIEWVSLDDHYLEAPVELGTGVEMTTQALRPGITTVEARLLDAGGETVATATVDVRVSYRSSWRVVQEGLVPYAPETVADVWVWNRHAFVARYHAGGISIIDLSGPTEVGRFRADVETLDVKVEDGVAYVAHEPDAGQYPRIVTTLVVTNPRAPVVLGGIPEAGKRGAHNVFVSDGLLSVTGGSRFDLYDVSEPADPSLVGSVRALNGIPHDSFFRDGLFVGAFLPSSAGRGELAVADISSPDSPMTLSHVRWQGDFTHSGWLSADGRYFFACDERVNAPIRIVDVSNPAGARVVGTYQPRLGTIPHNILVKDDRFAYLAHYKHGVEVIDVSDPTEPRLIGFYDTHPGAANDDLLFDATPTSDLSGAHEQMVFEGAWGVHWDDTGRIVVSDIQTGVFVLRFVGP